MMFTREGLLLVVKSNPEALVDIIMALQEQVQTLTKRVVELEQRLNKNSRNSSKPPSSDGPAKPRPKSLRKRSGKKPGGQKGHTGHTLQKVKQPDHVITLSTTCCSCSADLSHEPVSGYDCRQVFELPQPKLEVTEYRGEVKLCPKCGQSVKASFPEMVNAPVQYGPKFRGLLVYLHNQQLIPANRITQMMDDLYDAPVSEATILDASRRSHDNLAPFETVVIEALGNSPIIHADESGARTAGKLHWLHTASTESLTFYGVHEKRGTQAMDHFNILPNFRGRLIHDFWKPYLTYDCDHGLCNAHHLRELTFLFEQQNQAWAKTMFDLLLDMNGFVSKQKEQLTTEQKKPWLKQYRDILGEGWKANPLPKKPLKKKKGKPKKTKSQNLLVRLGDHESSVLAFLHDTNVPFTNNLAEQDIRMIKVRLKISGCFRTLQGAKQFARIRSYLSTARKQGRNILNAITDAINEQPFLPVTSR
ncbi:MAG: IS66 family transposase [Thermodesulfobacteriota bacterium]|nr:IS66 family transposase [Thermodesulfobacteriota bacterium]